MCVCVNGFGVCSGRADWCDRLEVARLNRREHLSSWSNSEPVPVSTRPCNFFPLHLLVEMRGARRTRGSARRVVEGGGPGPSDCTKLGWHWTGPWATSAVGPWNTRTYHFTRWNGGRRLRISGTSRDTTGVAAMESGFRKLAGYLFGSPYGRIASPHGRRRNNLAYTGIGGPSTASFTWTRQFFLKWWVREERLFHYEDMASKNDWDEEIMGRRVGVASRAPLSAGTITCPEELLDKVFGAVFFSSLGLIILIRSFKIDWCGEYNTQRSRS